MSPASAAVSAGGRHSRASPIAELPLLRFLQAELAPTPRRLRLALRTALVTTIAVGVTTAMQVAGPWAALIAFNLGQPALHIGPPAAMLIVAVAGFVQAAIVLVAGMIIDAPWLVLLFFFSVVGTSAALAISSRIPVAWILLNVGINAVLYMALFSPYAIGWTSAYIFSGIAVAAAFLALFEVVLWPVDEEPELRRSLAEGLRGARARLAVIGRAWSAGPGEPGTGVPPLESRLGVHLKLLEGVDGQHHDERRTARLLGEISQVERVAFATEKLALLATPRGSPNPSPELREETDGALGAAGDAIEGYARRVEALSAETDVEEGVAGLRTALSRLAAAQDRARAGGRVGAADEPSVDALMAGLGVLGDVVGSPPDALPAASLSAPAARALSSRLSPYAIRFGVKVGLASVLGLLIGLFANRVNLSVILWTVLIASLPGYGATVRKLGLRLLGAFAGGLITLGVIIVISASYDSLLAYLLVVLAVTWIGAYVAQSSERLSYAGIQLTNTFLILYIALEPKASEYDALWRFWGIVLGTLSVAFVELVVWPEHTAPRLRSSLGRGMRIASTLLPPDQPAVAPQLRRAEIDFLTELQRAAGLADEARLEGAQTRVDSAAALEALETLRRVAYRLIGLGLSPRTSLLTEADPLRSRIVRALNGRLMALAERINPSTQRASAAVDDELEAAMRLLRGLPLDRGERSEVESYGRVVGLLHHLERTLGALTPDGDLPRRVVGGLS